MKCEKYFAVSRKIAKKLNNHLKEFCINKPEFKKISEEYTKKEVHLNGTQFYAGFIATNSGKDFSKFCSIAIAIECVMLMAYKTNRMLDHKQEVWSCEEKIKETVLDEKMFLSLILELLKDSKENLGEKYNLVQDLILDLVSKINQGFWFEQNMLNVNFSSLDKILENWEFKYKKRNILFDGVYDYAPVVGYFLGSENESVFEKFENYFKDKHRLSHAGQIINDLSDFTSVFDKSVKSYQDTFSDIKNGIITQPVFEIIDEKIITDALKNSQLTKNIEWRKKVVDALIKRGVVEKIKIITEESRVQNIIFWKNIMGVQSELLFETYFLLCDNKYYERFLVLKKHGNL